MEKLKRILAVTLLACFFTSVHAQHYRAKSTLNSESYRLELHEKALLALDDSSFIKLHYGNSEPGFYRYNVIDKSLDQILSVEPKRNYFEARADNVLGKRLVRFGNRIIINSVGKLYISNGTAQGTSLLGDFGVTYVGGSAGDFYSNAQDIQDAGKGVLYFNVVQDRSFLEESNQIWRSDGTAIGTAQIQLPDNGEFMLLPESVNGDGSALVFAYTPESGYSFWKLSKDSNQLTFITAFEGGEERDFSIRGGVRMKAGYVFCRWADDGSSAWRLRGSTLTRLADECSPFDIHKFDDGKKMVFTSDLDYQLWFSDGSTANTKKVDFDTNILKGETFFDFTCSIGDTAYLRVAHSPKQRKNKYGDYVDFYETAMMAVSGASRDEISITLDAEPRGCFGNSLIVNDVLTNKLSVIDLDTGQKLPISGPNSRYSICNDDRTRSLLILQNKAYCSQGNDGSEVIELSKHEGIFMAPMIPILELLAP